MTEQLQEAAQLHYSLGLNVVPVHQGKFKSLSQVVRVALTQFFGTEQKTIGEEQKCQEPSTLPA